MRSYVKAYRSKDFKTLVKWPQGRDMSTFETVRLPRCYTGKLTKGLEPTFASIYTNLCRAAQIRYFAIFGDLASEIDMTSELGNSGLGLANRIYTIQSYSSHPLD